MYKLQNYIKYHILSLYFYFYVCIDEDKSQHLINKVEELEQNFQNSIKAIQCLKDEIDIIRQEVIYIV